MKKERKRKSISADCGPCSTRAIFHGEAGIQTRSLNHHRASRPAGSGQPVWAGMAKVCHRSVAWDVCGKLRLLSLTVLWVLGRTPTCRVPLQCRFVWEIFGSTCLHMSTSHVAGSSRAVITFMSVGAILQVGNDGQTAWPCWFLRACVRRDTLMTLVHVQLAFARTRE